MLVLLIVHQNVKQGILEPVIWTLVSFCFPWKVGEKRPYTVHFITLNTVHFITLNTVHYITLGTVTGSGRASVQG